jgi:hypothetical protein
MELPSGVRSHKRDDGAPISSASPRTRRRSLEFPNSYNANLSDDEPLLKARM